MANPEIPGNAPQNNLGVKGMNRGNLINFLLFRDFVGGGKKGKKGGGGGAVAQGGGRTRREMKNDMKMLRFQYELQDEFERAQTARAVEKAAQTDANAYQAADAFFGGGTIEGVSGAHTPKQIQNVEARPKKGNFKGAGGTSAGWEYADEQLGGEEPQANEDPDVTEDEPIVQQDGPIDDRRFTEKTKIRQVVSKSGGPRKGFSNLTPTQAEEANTDWEDFYKVKQEEASSAGVPWDKDLEDEVQQQYLQGKFSIPVGEVPESKRKDKELQPWIQEEPPAKSVPAVNEDASIDTGDVGNRPAPGGENGIAKGPQFNQ